MALLQRVLLLTKMICSQPNGTLEKSVSKAPRCFFIDYPSIFIGVSAHCC